MALDHHISAWRWLYIRLCEPYPPRWYWPIHRIFGGPGRVESDGVYMTRLILTPKTRWGQLYIHVFHREDLDRDPHDHPFPFWTFPLNQGYIEEVYDWQKECFSKVRAPHFKWSYRPATHIHRVTGCDHGWPLVTLVWRGTNKRKWGFWCHTAEKVARDPNSATRIWIPWSNYIYGSEHANIAGADNACPGVRKEYTQ